MLIRARHRTSNIQFSPYIEGAEKGSAVMGALSW